MAHLPIDQGVPGLQRAGAKAIAPPPGIANSGPDTLPIGTADAGQFRAIALRVRDARHHVHILGPTGSGKSELLARMVLSDVDADRGIVVIDPKGDLVEDILWRLPLSAADRVAFAGSQDEDGVEEPGTAGSPPLTARPKHEMRQVNV